MIFIIGWREMESGKVFLEKQMFIFCKKGWETSVYQKLDFRDPLIFLYLKEVSHQVLFIFVQRCIKY